MFLSSLILLSSLQTYEQYNDGIKKLNPCQISGNIVNIEFLKEEDYYCGTSQDIQFYIKGEDLNYKSRSVLYKNDMSCLGGNTSIFNTYNPMPKTEDSINFLVYPYGLDYILISDKKNENNLYTIPKNEIIIGGDGIINGNSPICKSNISDSEIVIAEKKSKISKYLFDLYKRNPKLARNFEKVLNSINLDNYTNETKYFVNYAVSYLDTLIKEH